MADIQTYAGPATITVLYIGLYYAFQLHIMATKSRLRRDYASRGERFDRYFGEDREMLAADRIMLNLLEHMPPFLALLWLNAVFVGPLPTTIAGAVYLGARALYPWLIGKRMGRGVPKRVLIATVTGYAVLVYLAGALLFVLLA